MTHICKRCSNVWLEQNPQKNCSPRLRWDWTPGCHPACTGGCFSSAALCFSDGYFVDKGKIHWSMFLQSLYLSVVSLETWSLPKKLWPSRVHRINTRLPSGETLAAFLSTQYCKSFFHPSAAPNSFKTLLPPYPSRPAESFWPNPYFNWVSWLAAN